MKCCRSGLYVLSLSRHLILCFTSNQSTQRVVTYCYAQTQKGIYDFSIPLADKIYELIARGYIIKQVSTTSFIEEGKPVIAYTFIIEK